jgi:hypothetical protein
MLIEEFTKKVPPESKLKVIGYEQRLYERTGRVRTFLLCECKCGEIKTFVDYLVFRGRCLSCGCYRKSAAKHGMSNSRVWGVWRLILRRCTEPTHKKFKHYGGRGIGVCEDWKNFECFHEYLKTLGLDERGEIPEGLEIDRIDNSRGYEPGNIRLVTRKENTRNTRVNRRITIDGVTRCVTEWAEVCGIDSSIIQTRLQKGWDEKLAVTAPIGVRIHERRDTRIITINGTSRSIPEWSEATGVSIATIRRRLFNGFDERAAVMTPVNDKHRRRRRAPTSR